MTNNRHGSELLGARLFYDAVHDGTNDPEMIMLKEYARYLSNGGTPDGWMNLSPSDVNIMHIYHSAYDDRMCKANAIYIANAISKLFGGGNNG